MSVRKALQGHGSVSRHIAFVENERQKYRYIFIEQKDGELFEGHPVYRIFNKKDKAQIGIISWFKPWKTYVFSSLPHCVFNNECLRDVLDFIENKIP